MRTEDEIIQNALAARPCIRQHGVALHGACGRPAVLGGTFLADAAAAAGLWLACADRRVHAAAARRAVRIGDGDRRAALRAVRACGI